MSSAVTAATGPDDLRWRNRVVLRVLLSIIATLLVTGLLVGIRW